MKYAVFSLCDYEKGFFKKLTAEYGYEFDFFDYELADAPESLDLSQYECISLLAIKKIDNRIIDRLTSCKLIALRTIGFQYIDIQYCKEKGIAVTNACYSPYNVADFTIMLMLMLLRKAKISVCRALVNDFSLDSLMGREIHSLKIGIIGAGKIGSTVMKELSGFHPVLYYYDLHARNDLDGIATYTDLETIYKECDIISLHMPLTDKNYHMINKEAISKMKKGVILVNTARGGLMDTEALIEGVESLHIGALGLDTIEGEDGLTHIAIGTTIEHLKDKKNIMYLKQFANVIFTQHYAFFTEEAGFSMVECTYKAMHAYFNKEEIPNHINR